MKRLSWIIFVLAIMCVVGGGSATSASASFCARSTENVGNFRLMTRRTCEMVGTAGQERFIIVQFLGSKIAPSEYCAEVAETGTGNYSNSSCTEKVETGKGKYIKIYGTEWIVLDSKGNKKLAGELSVQVQGELEAGKASLLTRLLKLTIEIRCTSGSLAGVSLKAEGKLAEGAKATFKGCAIYNGEKELAGCKPKTSGMPFGTVESKELKGGLDEESGEVKIEPKTGTEIARFEVGEECVLPSTIAVFGVIYLNDCENKMEEHLVKRLVSAGEKTSLWVVSDTAEHLETSLDGSGLIFLSGEHSGLAWGATLG